MNRYNDLVDTLNQFATPAIIEPLAFGEAMVALDNKAYTFTATLAVLHFYSQFH